MATPTTLLWCQNVNGNLVLPISGYFDERFGIFNCIVLTCVNNGTGPTGYFVMAFISRNLFNNTHTHTHETEIENISEQFQAAFLIYRNASD